MSVLSTALQGNLLNSRLGCAPVQWAGFLKQSLGRLMFCFFNGEVFVEKDQQETTVMMKSKMVCFEESNCDSLIGHVDSHSVFSYQKLRMY